MNRIDGKIAIITGSGSGIGRASCELLAEAGARIVATDINEERAMPSDYAMTCPARLIGRM